MANRRMLSLKIIDSARFLKMPLETQSLYFHLNMNADDDGVVEAFIVMRKIGATEDSLRILSAKHFITVLNEDLVTHITDWNENNKIRADRKVDSIYKDLLVRIVPDYEVLSPKKRAGTQGKPYGQTENNKWTTKCQPKDGIGKDRLGKDRLGKDRLGKDSKYIVEIVDFLNRKLNTKYSAKSKKTMSLINARLNEGFTYQDFEIVINKKYDEWAKDKKMCTFLRPETLFSNKFESYLNQTAAKSRLDLSDVVYDLNEEF